MLKKRSIASLLKTLPRKRVQQPDCFLAPEVTRPPKAPATRPVFRKKARKIRKKRRFGAKQSSEGGGPYLAGGSGGQNSANSGKTR
jgi:hypothetical protein